MLIDILFVVVILLAAIAYFYKRSEKLKKMD
jgi:hypothetical protein